MTYGQLYDKYKSQLSELYDTGEAQNITIWVFEQVTCKKKGEILLAKKETINEEEGKKLNDYLERLMSYEPVQYVLNECWFYKEKYYVDNRVLIPRPETEELVDAVIKKYKNIYGLQIIDIGSGSGCIPITLKKYMNDPEIISIDISNDALSVASKNASSLNASIAFKKLDFLNNDDWLGLNYYDIIISNPPYIPISQFENMNKNVTDFEPALALFVNDHDPFIFYYKIGEFAAGHLKNAGGVFVETHEDYAKKVQEIFIQSGLKDVCIHQDIYGRERFVFATKLFTATNRS